jgi:small subunit ribosomal protein S13
MLILGSQLNENKALFLTLQTIIGLNKQSAIQICSQIGVHPAVKLKKLRIHQMDQLTKICREEIDSNLPRKVRNNIQFLIQIKHYKGTRHMFGLPTRGQRTRTNGKTSKRLMSKSKRSTISSS